MREPTQLLVRDIMVTAPVAVPPDTTVAEAASLMGERNIGAVVVCRDGSVLGMFTERDLLRRAVAAADDWHSTVVAAFMTAEPVTIPADQPVPVAAELMDRHHIRHLPVIEAGKLVGMLSMRDLLQHRARYLEWLVQQRTAELEARNADLQESERTTQYHLEVAAGIQRQMLPPELPGASPFEFGVLYKPLDLVSGDYYDFVQLPSGRLGILIADASGHSVPAALVSVMAKTAFQHCGQGVESPAAVLRSMNQCISQLLRAGHFITMFYAVLDRQTLELTYAAAGHPAPLRYCRQRDMVGQLNAEGLMIGVLPDPQFEEHAVRLASGDALLLYTDGVIECKSADGALFGRGRLERFLQERANLSADRLAAELEAELTRFRGRHRARDDITCIALRVLA